MVNFSNFWGVRMMNNKHQNKQSEQSKKNEFNVAVVGATGRVGETFLNILHERNFPVSRLFPFASPGSEGKEIIFNNKPHKLLHLAPSCFESCDIVFFSSGDDISQEWAPQAVSCGAITIDNSAAFRMHPEVPLVVPEINGHLLNYSDASNPLAKLIANPNCSTIQLVIALQPLQQAFGLQSVRVASYQSVSGAGRLGEADLYEQSLSYFNNCSSGPGKAFPHNIAFNCLPHIGSFDESGFCSEEQKIMKETKKILNLPNLAISAFTVRVPTWNGHSEVVWFSLNESPSVDDIRQVLHKSPGLKVLDNTSQNSYPLISFVSGTDDVYVGRIHKDLDFDNSYIIWVVADNLRKGAALNGIQIAERIFDITPTNMI